MRNYNRFILLVAVIWIGLSGLNVSAGEIQEAKQEYRNEIQQSREREMVQVNKVQEDKVGDFETGKTITDIHGDRVRIEQFILRPKSNQYQYLVYNTRPKRFDTGYFLMTYNKDLPSDLGSIIFQDEVVKERPEYYKTDQEIRMSNGQDFVLYQATNGNVYQDGLTTFKVYYNEEKLTVNNYDKIKITRDDNDPGQNLKGFEIFWFPDANGSLQKCFDTNNTVYDWNVLPGYENKVYNPEAHTYERFDFVNNTFYSNNSYWITDDGKIMKWSDLSGQGLTQENWKTEVSKWNNEIVIKATEFGDRDIDLIWSPHSMAIAVYEETQ